MCDPIDERHRGILPPDVWGDGDPEGVRQRAADKVEGHRTRGGEARRQQVNGFTGSSVWHLLYSFPPNDFDAVEARLPRLRRPLEPDPGRLRRGGRPLRARGAPDRDRVRLRHHEEGPRRVDRREAFGINFDPSHFAHQFLDSAAYVEEFADRIYHVHVKDSRKRLDGRRSILGSHLQFGEGERGWDFVSPGHGDVDFEELFRALNRIGYDGPLSIEWEDSGMDRDWGAPDALQFVRRTDFAPSAVAFDAAFAKED